MCLKFLGRLPGFKQRGAGSYEQTIIPVPPLDGNPLNENTPGYMSMAFVEMDQSRVLNSSFPHLFPDGQGDFHQNRVHKVEFGAYIKHLMQFKGGRFARDRRFPWFAFNTLQRHRTHGQAKVLVKRHHNTGRLTAGELKALLEEGDQHVATNMSQEVQMQTYVAATAIPTSPLDCRVLLPAIQKAESMH
ncbi:hypothetical protein B0H14DRAFT_3175542 [Mycena olivaceomarginata]|nr:hypothetical protein B0H14DRAFT_3175542 [Mycena olivaceomarginata]